VDYNTLRMTEGIMVQNEAQAWSSYGSNN
jgi:hypothetical protein